MTTHELNRQGVRRVSYEPLTQELRIEFVRGQVYAYEAVPEGIVTWLVRTKDIPGYLQRVITPGFVYRKVNATGARTASPTSEADLEAQLRASLSQATPTPTTKAQGEKTSG